MTNDERTCPACGATAGWSRTAAVGKQSIGGGPLVIVSCSCGAAFQPVAPSVEDLARWYDYMGHNAQNVQTSPLLDRRLGRMVRAFEPCRRTGRLLEVGCGGGLFVRAAIARGWEVWGTEISPSCARVLEPLLAGRLHQGTVQTAPFAAESFDGAALIEVIEHLADPLPYLAAIRDLLRPGGRLFLTTPNARGAAARVLGTRWRAFTDEHLTYFDRRSIEVLLSRAGFVDVQVQTTNLDLIVLAWQLRRQLPRFRRPPRPAATTRQEDDSPRVRRLRRPAIPMGVADSAIEAVNWVARVTQFGDTLKITARRP